MTSEKVCRKDKNQNIQVFVRLRPLNQRERDIKSLGVVEVVNSREVVVRQSQQTSLTKKFTFDRAFGPHAKQVEVYQEVVSPLIEEVLAGYNCTVFAYGQTGTGKTHTMVGENTSDETTWQNDPLAGIIPRALSQLFDELRISNTEYTVRVSYLELYNEELFDLLSSSEDNSKLRIYEDVTRKGSNIVNGLEEITVYNKNEVYKIMAQGQERKRVASTLMNAQSSRSHTVFTIVVHMKENSPEGEELVKIGKLNLVDLAGSENISKAGSDNPAKRERARECVNINQSLLTLGRVITALVERHPHIPYRESKLTRILQESLGGRTKTSIIATVSPGHKDLEETMSTLEYAHRAKNIQNKPEINQKMTKKAILKEFAEEIDKLKKDLQAARDKNGVYLASDTFAEMTLKQEEQRKEIQELLLKKRAMEEERDRAESVFNELNQKLQMTGSQLDNTRAQLNTTKAQLVDTTNMLRTKQLEYEEQKYLVASQQQTEHKLGAQAKELVQVADTVAAHAAALHDNIATRRSIESANLEVTRTYRRESAQQRTLITTSIHQFADTLLQTLNGMHSTLDNFTTNTMETHDQNISKLSELINSISEATNEMKCLSEATHARVCNGMGDHRNRFDDCLGAHINTIRAALEASVTALTASLQNARDIVGRNDVANFVNQWYTDASGRVSSLQRLHARLVSDASDAERRRREVAKRHQSQRTTRAQQRQQTLQNCMQQIEEEKAEIQGRLKKQLEDIEQERSATEERLQLWVEEERRLLEERLAKHLATERQALEERLNKKMIQVEEEQKLLEDRIARHVNWQKQQLQDCSEDLEMADKDLEEYESGMEDTRKHFTKYNKEFEEGSSAVSADLEVLTRNVCDLTHHVCNQLYAALMQAENNAQQQANELAASSNTTREQLTSTTENILSEVVKCNKEALLEVYNRFETNTTLTAAELSRLSASITTIKDNSRNHLSTQSETLEAVQHHAMSLDCNVKEAVLQCEYLENKYLNDEYRMYTSTGSTPVRRQYSYPRVLAATSPHERILARYRQQRVNPLQDVVVIESDGELAAGSESETSSEEIFAEPSPLVTIPTSTPAICKSTSETDIYVRRKQQDKEQAGKENPDRSMHYRKPSKLPAPSSIKKPLIERNGTIN
ncbi:unnamed protein product [Chilo suppressalis]|uniref:Kinesin motor domain-containing protein n=1 Tax=Chilo suppressalis TaxID=168631 RepID=A0ABN8L935_CHISP|nr:unnamed protein product [Chilo suppressalis]